MSGRMRSGTGHWGGLARAAAVIAGGLATGALISTVPDTVDAAPRLPRAKRVKANVIPGIDGVGLDQRIEIRFSRAVRGSAVGPDNVEIAPPAGPAAAGQLVVGKLLFDKSTRRNVVVRPEAVEEYYRLVERLPREQAVRRAERLLRRIERTGKTRLLRNIDRGLLDFFGASSGHVARLDAGFFDSPADTATYPPQVPVTSPLAAYRRLIAGDDALWQAHLDADPRAYAQLAADPERDRFHHAVDEATGVPAGESALRRYEYRRVLVDRRAKRVVTFLPRLPQKPEFAVAGLLPETEYRVRVAGTKGIIGRFTTRVLPLEPASPFVDTDWPEIPPWNLVPRVINVTPPDGELLVVPTTDWEDPDDLLATPVGDRRPFRIRLRFDVPLDPRSLTPGAIRLSKVGKYASSDPVPVEPPVPVHVDLSLEQSRLGRVELSVTPRYSLDPDGVYEVRVETRLRALYGGGFSNAYRTTFSTAPGLVSLDPIVEDFSDSSGRAEGVLWPAPPELDPDGLGLAMAAGTGGGQASSVTSHWIDLGHDSLVLSAVHDDPETPEVEGTRTLLPAAGGSAEIFVRGAFQDIGLEPGSPDLNTPTSWFPLDGLDLIGDRRLVQFRIDFTLPEGFAPGDPRPAVDRIEIGLSDR